MSGRPRTSKSKSQKECALGGLLAIGKNGHAKAVKCVTGSGCEGEFRVAVRLIFISRASILSFLTSQHLLINTRPPATGLVSCRDFSPRATACPRRHPSTAQFHRRLLEQPRDRGGRDQGLRGGARDILQGIQVKDAAEIAAWEFIAAHKSERSLGISSFSGQTSFRFILFTSQIPHR